jgi:N-acetyllactosaminide beta-1,3-N-acetylglucosaminyltransferase
VAGYKFAVLNNAFLVHKGFKVKDNFHLTKDMEQEQNRLLFRHFKEELKTKYPQSHRRCY